MMKKSFRVVCIILSVVLLTFSLIGCSKNQNSSGTGTTAGTTAGDKQESTNATDASVKNKLPIVEEPITLTFFCGLGGKLSQTAKSWSEVGGIAEIQKRTGITIKFVHPPVGQESEQFNIMCASNELTDLISWDWRNFSGGPGKAINDKLILDLTDLMKTNAPSFMELMQQNPEWRKQSVTDDSKYYMFPFIRGSEYAATSYGFQVRKDWLEKLGLAQPSTMDEWYTVLKAFKESDPNGNGKKDEIPFMHIANWGGFKNFKFGFGLTNFDNGFYLDGGKVKYSFIEPGYKDFITTMRKWYEEGLIDPEYPLNDTKSYDSKWSNDLGGAQYGGCGMGFMGKHLKMMKETVKNTEFSLVGIPSPKNPKGEVWGMKEYFATGNGTAISPGCKYKEEAVEFLDYWYSPEGSLLANFGVEGVAYEMVDGKPQYTDFALKNPDGLSFDFAALKQGLAPEVGPFVQNELYWRTSTSFYPEQKETMDNWVNKESTEWKLPPATVSGDKGKRYISIMSEVNTYTQEMEDKFIMGVESLDKYNDFINTIKKMNIDEAIQIRQEAVDSYNKR